MIQLLADSQQGKAFFRLADDGMNAVISKDAQQDFNLLDKEADRGISERRDYGSKQQSDDKRW